MKKQTNALKISLLGAAVAALGAGCASSGYARHDADNDMDTGVGVSARAEMGTDSAVLTTDEERAAAQSTVSALGRSVETRAEWVNKHPFYDYNIRTIEMYTFAVPDPTLDLAANTSDAPEFSVNLEPGAVFVEAAGGEGEVRTGRVIQHSPNPMR